MGAGLNKALVLAAAAAVLASGCGGGDGDNAISKQDYVKRVRQRCSQYQRERRPLDRRLSELGDPSKLTSSALTAVADDIVKLDDTTRRVVRDLRALPRPKDGRDRLDRALAAMQPGVGALDAADRAARAGDAKALTAAYVKVGVAFAKANTSGAEFGLNSCG